MEIAGRRVFIDRMPVAEIILLEIADQTDNIMKDSFSTGSLHQQVFGAEHFRHFRQDAGASCCDYKIRDLPGQGIGGDP